METPGSSKKKTKQITTEESGRRHRETHAVAIRKERKEEHLAKRRVCARVQMPAVPAEVAHPTAGTFDDTAFLMPPPIGTLQQQSDAAASPGGSAPVSSSQWSSMVRMGMRLRDLARGFWRPVNAQTMFACSC